MVQRLLLLFSLLLFGTGIQAQQFLVNRSSVYAFTGTSGANLSQFNELLKERGILPIQNKYNTFGLGYQARLNDFIFGFELSYHQSRPADIEANRFQYRTSRALVNLGYSLTEEGKFQLIHYLSLGMGNLNVQLLPSEQSKSLAAFLKDPGQGFILRENNIQNGTRYYGDFLTEIGFQLSYDFPIPNRKEALEVIVKAGYSFSPFEDSWKLNGLSFDNAQAGAFFRVGTGISLPDRNFFYKDATIGITLIRGFHFSEPEKFNTYLREQGYLAFEGSPSQLGLRILGETDGLLYGMDVFNVSQKGRASTTQSHSLNSLRIYANAGMKFFEYKNWGIGALGGLGYGNLRYSLLQDVKPDFPTLLDERNFDGYLRKSGIFIKPELLLEYGLPMTKRKMFDLVFSTTAGYEVAFPGFKLGGLSMNSYQSGPFVTVGVGIRP
ncbi:MAG: hypothetical protein O2829_03815 [Bacteroidetes bacterium]|nr:hypothetical protein [Bacteroidota bacterium]MDA1268199.1 hypothetical protein [Bacteroidota bacterium]